MARFNFSDYDYEDNSIKEPKKLRNENTKKPLPARGKFDFSAYENAPEEKKYIGQYAHLTESEYKKLSPEKKKELQDYVPLTGFAKGFAKGATLGASELVPGLEVQEHETGSGAGEFTGAVAPIAAAAKALSYPFKALQSLTNFGKVGNAALRTTQAAATGATVGTGKEVVEAIKGNEFNPAHVAQEAAVFATLHGVFEAGTGAYKWLKSLKPAQQSQMLVDGVIPENLTPNQYKFYETEVVPELQKSAEKEYTQLLNESIEKNELSYKQELANAQAKHEADLRKTMQEKQISSEEFAESKKRYEEKVNKINEEHQKKNKAIEDQNAQAKKDFEKQKQEYELLKKRQEAVQAAIQPQSGGTPLQGRVGVQGEDIGYRPAAPYQVDPTLKNRVGNIISPNVITNTTSAGRSNIEAVRANDAIDYGNVRNAYALSEDLNSKVVADQGNLVQDLRRTASNIRSIPDPSPPQKQLLTTIERILNETQVTNEAGDLVGLQPVNNRVLQEQAKSLRYFMDFNFEHGNSRGIFSPTVTQLENAIEAGARSTGNEAAIEANREARRLYSEWAQTYDNPYIRPYRDTGNLDYSKTFKSSLETDNFNVLNNVLNRSNAGQQLANSTRRELVDHHLSKFFENPRSYSRTEFDKTLSELQAVISPEEAFQIRQTFNQVRKTPVVVGKKVDVLKEPKEISLKELPKNKIPEFTKKPRQVKEVESVKIPLKKEVKPSTEMNAVSKKMNITPEEAIKKTNTPSGLKELKKDLSPQLYERIGKNKVKDIFYEGNVQRKFTGDELYKIINKGDNYALLSEILGEDVASDLLVNAHEIAGKKATVDMFKKLGMKTASLKALLVFGVL